ncbi:RipA family octameric membrane protein [Streptomyces prasinus]|uniref:RipA family octameric membrane protein n=1 Tax=Streptomyces prasinus TaxID=67345 RepID=UPI003696C5BA
MNYLEQVAADIRAEIPPSRLPDENIDDLLNMYAALALSKGADVTASDVHDTWTAWQTKIDPDHAFLVPYDQLPSSARQQEVFVTAIRQVAERNTAPDRIVDALFPYGPPTTEEDKARFFELYKVMVQSSESLVSRRQGVNTFFITVNGAILTGLGFFIKAGGGEAIKAVGLLLISLTGLLLAQAWKSLIISFGQLNTGKFAVINRLERYLPAAIFFAEWEALDRGQNPKVYRSATSREIWAPYLLMMLYSLVVVGSFLVAIGVWDL